MTYYNEFDPKAAAWLRELIKAGHLPAGDVDERSIEDVKAAYLAGYDQCHFFAGIGGWPYALRLAGWPDDRPVWTGSCPCQPFSCAGRGQGHADKRHLWPAFYKLIAECRPATVFGEQVASKLGREWFAGVRLDLEDLGYACGGADLCAAGVGAPHRRQRLFWVADVQRERLERNDAGCVTPGGEAATSGRSSTGGMADAELRRPEQRDEGQWAVQQLDEDGAIDWSRYDILPCRDGKARRVESQPLTMADGVSTHLDALRNAGLDEDQIGAAVSTFPLTQNAVGRMMLLRGIGNAIVPQIAAKFISAAMGEGERR